MARQYTMSEKALAARHKKRNLSPEERQRRAEHMKKYGAGGWNKLPPRLRVMVDKALYESAIGEYGTLDKALSALLAQ